MNIKHLLLGWAFFLALLPTLFAQQKGISNIFLIEQYGFYQNTGAELSHERYFAAMAGQMHLAPDSKMILEEEVEGHNGFSHYRYRQAHKGVPVFGCTYVLHEKDGRVTHATGRYQPQITTSVNPAIDEATAIAFAKRAMKAGKYQDKLITATLMLVDPAFPGISEHLALAYQVDLVSVEPANKHRYFVDAMGGKVVCDFPLILQHGVPSTAQTKYYGVRDIISDSIAPQQFVLRDPTRGEGIFIYHDNGSTFTNNSSHWDLTNSAMDEVALDAHFCTQEYYDVMLEHFDWEGQDGQGKALKVKVHSGGSGFVNAFWDGEYSNYGDGDCNYGPLTTLEVVGHEFTHGMIDYTSQLVYSGESGAINECMADIFGKYLEYKTDPAFHDWALGHSFILNPESSPFRQMDDPNSLGMPAMYNGMNWEADNGVHTNSAIGNLWYVMLVDGRQGINEAGVAFNVTGIGFDKAARIAFLTNRVYLTESSDYNNFYQYSVIAAEELYGPGSTEVNAVKEAWKAVGLPSNPFGPFDLAVAGEQNWGENICGLGGYFPIKVTVVNRSSESYNPAMGGSVELSHFTASQNYTYPLTSPIGPGESFTFEVNDWLEIAEPGYYIIDISLQLLDSEPLNNFSQAIYAVVTHESDDLELFVFADDSECFADSVQTAFYVSNNSCQPVPEGTILTFTVTDDQSNQVWSGAHTLATELRGGGTAFISYYIPASAAVLTYTLQYAPDPDLFNNQYIDAFNTTYLPIIGDYLNDFEINNGNDGYLNLAFGSGAGTVIAYNNSKFFGSTGSYPEGTFTERCPDPLTAFDQSYSPGITAGIKACVDMTGFSNPELSFDLVMFRNTAAQVQNFPYSSMLQAKWQGNQSGREVFFGQQEAVIVNKSIPLPANFKGAITLTNYTEVGEWFLDPTSFANDDIVLLDNIRISTTVSTSQPQTAGAIQVYPNPAHDMIRVEAKEGIQQIQLQDVNGRILKTIQVQNDFINLSLVEIPKGLYFLAIQLENGSWSVRKALRM
jgi:Zn-dependent metalloprotease